MPAGDAFRRAVPSHQEGKFMRHLISIPLLTAIAGIAVAADPPLPKSADHPILVTAKATKADNGVVLHVRLPEMAPAQRTTTVKVPVQIQKIVNGQVVVDTQMQDQQRQITVMQPVRWRTVDVPVDGKEVVVYDTKGQEIAPDKLADQLKDEKPILATPSGPVDPYFLQTTKGDTLVVRIPPQLLFGQQQQGGSGQPVQRQP
jgi:hypothetical protein